MGFRHLGLAVPDTKAFQERLESYDVPFVKRIGEKVSKELSETFGIRDAENVVFDDTFLKLEGAVVFVRDPDGYLVEANQVGNNDI